MAEVKRAGRGDTTRVGINECDSCNPDNITIIPRYRIEDSLSDNVSCCNYCGREWDEFWICYAYVARSLINRRQLEAIELTLCHARRWCISSTPTPTDRTWPRQSQVRLDDWKQLPCWRQDKLLHSSLKGSSKISGKDCVKHRPSLIRQLKAVARVKTIFTATIMPTSKNS